MPLNPNQLNAHLRTIMQDELVAAGQDLAPAVFHFLLRACIRHRRLGGADDQEAARTIAQFIFEQVIGRSATADDLHRLRNHYAIEADSTAAGVLG